MKSWERALIILDSSPSKGSAKLLLVAIALHTNESTGDCHIGRRRLAKYLGTDERWVKRLLAKVEQSGELERSIGTGPSGANRYRLMGGGVEPPGAQRPPGPTVSKQGGVEPPRTRINHKQEDEEKANPAVVLFCEYFDVEKVNAIQKRQLGEVSALHDESTVRKILEWAAGSGINDTGRILKAAESWRKARRERGNGHGENRQGQSTVTEPDPEQIARDRELAELARKRCSERTRKP